MKRAIAAVLIWGLATPVHAQVNHQDIVVKAKSDLRIAGQNFTDCGGFQIVLLTVWRLRTEGAGLLDKPSGSHCEWPIGSGHFYASDIVTYPDGHIYDILISSGDPDPGPSWQDDGLVDASRYRPAILVPDPPVSGGGVVTPLPSTDLTFQHIIIIEQAVADIRQKQLEYETAAAAERARQEAFRQAVGIQWAKVTGFIAKYGAIIAGTLLAGKASGL